MKTIVEFLLGAAIGFVISYRITRKILDLRSEAIDIDSCEDCPIYIERNDDNTYFHYKD